MVFNRLSLPHTHLTAPFDTEIPLKSTLKFLHSVPDASEDRRAVKGKLCSHVKKKVPVIIPLFFLEHSSMYVQSLLGIVSCDHKKR